MNEVKQKKAKVLIIEDDFRINKVYSIKLQMENINISVATEGNEGLRKAYEEKPDLIILDLMLPGINGFEILKRIKENKDSSINSIPVLIMSNLGSESDIQKGLKLGAVGYIIKAEMSINDVVKKIKNILQRSNQ